MKKLLIPLLSLTTITTVSTMITGCSYGSKIELTPLSIDYLDIRDNTLYGFKDQYKYKESIAEGNYKLTIPKDVNQLDIAAFAYSKAADGDSQLLIQAIDFAKDCACTDIGMSAFNGCANIKKVTLPPKLNTWGSALFTGCPNLTSIDLSNLEQNVICESWYAPNDQRWPRTGTITYLKDNSNQKALADKLLAIINSEELHHEWTIETK